MTMEGAGEGGLQGRPGAPATGGNHRKKVLAAAIFGIVAVIGIIAVIIYLSYTSTHISTDDAFVDGRIYTVAPKISGTVKAIYVDDNYHVDKGDLLLEIDTRDYDVRVGEASAALGSEEKKLDEDKARLAEAKKGLEQQAAKTEQARANLELERADLAQAERDTARADFLFSKEAISKERHEKIETGYDVAVARVKAAKDMLSLQESAIGTQKAMIKRAEAAIESQDAVIGQKVAILSGAELNLGYTKLYAPVEGYISKKTVQIGNQVQPGLPLMAVVPLSDIWVTANYKETQLDKIKPGQKAEIKVDAYPGGKFKGHVDSIMAGTGAVFSLFPPENATGNYVKVVQRVPVKIVLEKGEDPGHVLRMGMSVVPTVLVGK